MSLKVHDSTVITTRSGCGGCLLRNERIADNRLGPALPDGYDADISVEGGVWRDIEGGDSVNDPSPIMRSIGKMVMGVLFFGHAERVTVRNLTIGGYPFYGVLLADCHDFAVSNIYFDNNHRDGVHVNAPAARGLIENLSGHCNDDVVALNAWDWDTSAISFGSISDIVVRNIECDHNEMRLLPGRKAFPDGTKMDCVVERCHYENISGVYNFKLYQQHNCDNPWREFADYSETAGLIRDVCFKDIYFRSLVTEGISEVQLDGLFEMGADCENITFENLHLNFTKEELRKSGMAVAMAGPKSSTWTQGNPDPAQWSELFDPDTSCTADNITFRNICFADGKCTDRELLIYEQHLSVNPDYPNSKPQGGTGCGTVKRVTIE